MLLFSNIWPTVRYAEMLDSEAATLIGLRCLQTSGCNYQYPVLLEKKNEIMANKSNKFITTLRYSIYLVPILCVIAWNFLSPKSYMEIINKAHISLSLYLIDVPYHFLSGILVTLAVFAVGLICPVSQNKYIQIPVSSLIFASAYFFFNTIWVLSPCFTSSYSERFTCYGTMFIVFWPSVVIFSLLLLPVLALFFWLGLSIRKINHRSQNLIALS